MTESTYVIEMTGNQQKLDSFVGAIDRALILETVRSWRYRHRPRRPHPQDLRYPFL